MKNLFLILIILFLFSSCKKDGSASTDPLYIDFTVDKNTGVSTFPAVLTFTSIIPDVADEVNWDFGDGTTGSGEVVNHSYASYGLYVVTVTAQKGSRLGNLQKKIPVTMYRKIRIGGIKVISIEPVNGGNFPWDQGVLPDLLPDLTYRITFPGNRIYNSSSVRYNVDNTFFNIAPYQESTALDSVIKFEILDRDTGNTPDYEVMGSLSLSIPEYAVTVPDSVELVKNRTHLRIFTYWGF